MPQTSKGKAQEGIPGSFAKKRSLLPSAVTSITRNMWNKLSSSSQEAHPLMMDESFSFLPYLLSRDLMFFFVNLPSIKEPPLEWTFWVNFCCWSPSCPLPFFAPSVLLPVGSNIPSRLPSLHLLGQIFFHSHHPLLRLFPCWWLFLIVILPPALLHTDPSEGSVASCGFLVCHQVHISLQIFPCRFWYHFGTSLCKLSSSSPALFALW